MIPKSIFFFRVHLFQGLHQTKVRICTWMDSEQEKYQLKAKSIVHVMNSTCIRCRGSRPKYIHVQVEANIQGNPYTIGKIQIHIYI
uniref:Uncharacterized protein n=1 Tax=Arundo donax TaxID=35708 RepID=A0A0A9EBQ3_ARUDO